MTYAGFWQRFAAFIVDGCILFAAALLLLAPFGGAMTMLHIRGDELRHNPLILLTAGLMLVGLILAGILGRWFYFTMFESSVWQATPGKRLMGIFVTDESGRRISMGRASGRYFGRFLNHITLGIGYLMIAFTHRKQGLHDVVASTFVIQRGPGIAAPPR